MIVSLVVLAAILAPTITPHDPLTVGVDSILTPPFWQEKGTLSHPLGTDHIGRDVWSRLVYGAKTSLVVGLGGLAVGGALGTAFGFISGYWRGSRDRIFDVSLPRLISPAVWLVCCLLFAIWLVSIGGTGLISLIIVIGLVTWPRYIKTIRGEVMRLDTSGSIARGRGSAVRFLFSQVVGALPALFISQMGFLIILESILSFLGIGVPPPTPSFGSMVADGRMYLASAWWVSAFPLVCIALAATGFYLVGNYLATLSRNSRAAPKSRAPPRRMGGIR